MSQYFPSYITSSGHEEIKVDLDLTNYATQQDLKNITYAETSSFALKTNLNILKTEVDKLDILKLVPVPVDLAKLSKKVQSNQTKNETELSSLKTSKALKVQSNNSTTNNLKTKVDGIDLTKYVKKTDYDTKVGNLELKLSGKLNTLDFNSNITELENKIKTAEN